MSRRAATSSAAIQPIHKLDGFSIVRHPPAPEPAPSGPRRIEDAELIEKIRRLRYVDQLAQNKIAEQLGISGMLVAKYAPSKSREKYLKERLLPHP
eukprot:tig00000203_g17115.t1